MLVNISKAAKLAGIGRDTLYKNYINKGKISTTRDERNRPMVDTSEILRVFGVLQSVGDTDKESVDTIQKPTLENTPHTPPNLSAQLAQLQAENAQLRERLEEAKERESWQRGQIDKLTDTIKLLEAPRATTPPPAPPTQAEKLKGFIERVLGR
jgi:hypothetical protein